jgi:hypothetical protein
MAASLFGHIKNPATAMRAHRNWPEESASFRAMPHFYRSTQRHLFAKSAVLNALSGMYLGLLPSIVESGWRTLSRAARIRPPFFIVMFVGLHCRTGR